MRNQKNLALRICEPLLTPRFSSYSGVSSGVFVRISSSAFFISNGKNFIPATQGFSTSLITNITSAIVVVAPYIQSGPFGYYLQELTINKSKHILWRFQVAAF